FLTGANLRSADVIYDPMDLGNQIKVSLAFDRDGTEAFADLTSRYANQTPKRQLAILLDGVVRSAPAINDPILDGRAVIEGGFSNEEATLLSQVLKAGSLPAPLVIESQRTVGATLGADSILS